MAPKPEPGSAPVPPAKRSHGLDAYGQSTGVPVCDGMCVCMPLAAILSALPSGAGSANSPPASLPGTTPPRWPSPGRRARASPRCGAPGAAAAAAAAGCRVLRSEPSAGEADLSLRRACPTCWPACCPTWPPTSPALSGRRSRSPCCCGRRGRAARPPARSAWPCWPRCASCLRGRAGARWPSTTCSGWTRRSLDALTFALRRVAAGRCRLLLAARTDVPADPLTVGAPPLPHGWRDLLAAAPATRRSSCRPAGPRGRCSKLLPPTVTAAQARLVARQSRGNPFWAREIAASLDSAEAPGTAAGPHADRPAGPSLTPEAAEALAVVAAAGRIAHPRRAGRAPATSTTRPPRWTRRCWPAWSSRPTARLARPPTR